jgi:hypothetical protein
MFKPLKWVPRPVHCGAAANPEHSAPARHILKFDGTVRTTGSANDKKPAEEPHVSGSESPVAMSESQSQSKHINNFGTISQRCFWTNKKIPV